MSSPRPPWRRAARASLFAIAALAAAAAPSAAHFAMPKSVDFLPRPGHPNDLYLEVSFGLLESHDAGATWQYYCEDPIQGEGYAGSFIPDMAIASTNTLFATTIIGLRARRDGCTFEATQFGESFIAQVTVASDGTVYAAAANGVPHDSSIYKSTDDGVTFAPTAATTPGDEAGWTSLEVAPSDTQRVYATGYRLVSGGREVTMYRSDDAGASWTPLSTADFALTKNSDVVITSISPDDPDFLIARMTHRLDGTDADAVYRSTNAGQTWAKVKEFDSTALAGVIRKLTGAGPAATKAQVLLGAGTQGVWTSADGGQTFAKTAATEQILCLREHDGTLYGCADSNSDSTKSALGSSTDAASFSSMVKFRDITSITSCPSGTVVHDQCELVRWCFVRDLYGITANPTNCAVATDAGITPDAGTTPEPPDSCCFAGGASAANGLIGVIAIAPWLRRRRRRS